LNYPDLVRERDQARNEGRWVGIGLSSYAELTGIGSQILRRARYADQYGD
jgi:carbon-monoxide dehydrogenase large subunit